MLKNIEIPRIREGNKSQLSKLERNWQRTRRVACHRHYGKMFFKLSVVNKQTKKLCRGQKGKNRRLSTGFSGKTTESFRSLVGQKPNHSGSKTEGEFREWGE